MLAPVFASVPLILTGEVFPRLPERVTEADHQRYGTEQQHQPERSNRDQYEGFHSILPLLSCWL